MTGARHIVFTTLLVCAAGFAGTAVAADASAWNDDLRSAMRLIAGSNSKAQAPWRAGVEIKMMPGWHTYWRYAGDSGVPPHFDFSGSENLKTATVHYPAPQILDDGAGGKSLGYTGNVIFPVAVTPRDPAKPVQLHIKLDYAVCEKICVPATGKAALSLAAAKSAQDDALRAAEARVPQPASAADLGLTARRADQAGKESVKPLVMVDVAAPAETQLLVEGPTPEWALPLPQPAQGAPAGHQHFSFVLDGLPPGVSPGKGPFDLTFTIITPARAYEARARLD